MSFNLEIFLKENNKAKELFNSLFTIKQKEYYYSRKLQKLEMVKTRNDLINIIKEDYPEFFDVIEKGARQGQLTCNLDASFFSIAFFNNSIEMVEKSIDLFSNNKISLKRIDKTLFITKNHFNFIMPKDLNIDAITYNIIIGDYKEHFRELDSILEWIIACKFTDNRRQSYLHLQIPAGFGKSFLKELLGGIGMTTECRYDDFKSPSSLNPNEFENSLCMIIDEFTAFKKEFKDMTNKMFVDSKYALRTRVNLYAKIFLSAESSNSFTGGVDEQITDRINLIDKSNAKRLENRSVYIKYGNKIYFNSIQQYIYSYITNAIEYFTSLGEIEASKQAEIILKDFYKTHKLRAENIIDTIKINFFSKLYEIYDANDYELSILEQKIKKNIITTSKFLHIKQTKSTFEDILKCFGEDFYKKSRYKINNFEEIFNIEIKNHKVFNKTIRCARFEKDKIINLFEDDNENIKEKIELMSCPF